MLSPRPQASRAAALDLGFKVLAASLLVGVLLGLTGCDDPLPGFANPPPYDAGDAADPDEDGDAG